ncbi:tRNA dihydrouridine synthase DusB [candidate division KSB1 bacterium]|nr:tRNA dihydrouridine synthase DusB [candidate division KSB1 bacterium]MBL7095017.1 tRNA dihydrouridine synthase DusB [candidate division KSB1 bacterium]
MTFDNLKLDGKVVLAPMAGITDSSYRVICREMGASMVFSEMISADGLYRKNENTQDYLFFRQNERPIGYQLFGSDPGIMPIAVDMLLTFRPDFIDLNFGCPVTKVVKRGAGAALLKDIPTLTRIAKGVVRLSTVPVFAKIRKGWDEQNINAYEVARILEQCGIKAITIHPRTRAQQFGGRSDWDVITKIKNIVSIPVIGSGDIQSAQDAKKMLDETGCDLVMIGRGALGNPWIFKQANYFLKTGQHLPEPNLTERLKVILNHFDDKIKMSGPQSAMFEMRKHFAWYVKGLPGCTDLKVELFKLKNIDDIRNTLNNYFQDLGAE